MTLNFEKENTAPMMSVIPGGKKFSTMANNTICPRWIATAIPSLNSADGTNGRRHRAGQG
jgi:hypothetical protein